MDVKVRFVGPKDEEVLATEAMSCIPRTGEEVVIGGHSYRVFDVVWEVGEGTVPFCSVWLESVG
jgi:hypothetical protein